VENSEARSCCITAENVYGEKGRGGIAELSEIPQPEVTLGGEYSHPRQRHCIYRFHHLDPVHFARDLQITVQALG